MFHINIWNNLAGANVRLPHAMLFAGPKGVGKRELAEALAARLLCETPRMPGESACGSCPSCLMWAGGQHPDYRLLQPEGAENDEGEGSDTGEKKKSTRQIRVSQVRELEDFFHVGAHRGGNRVCIIDPAEAMNSVTANFLLKILEEPSLSFYFILISHRWRRLLPTILSRAQRIMFQRPAEAEAQQWMAEHKLSAQAKWLPFFGYAPFEVEAAAQGGRLKALETVIADLLDPDDPLKLAARWENLIWNEKALGLDELVIVVQKWLLDLARCLVGVSPRYFGQLALQPLAKRTSYPTLLQTIGQFEKLRAISGHPLNTRLFLEDICIRALRPLKL